MQLKTHCIHHKLLLWQNSSRATDNFYSSQHLCLQNANERKNCLANHFSQEARHGSSPWWEERKLAKFAMNIACTNLASFCDKKKTSDVSTFFLLPQIWLIKGSFWHLPSDASSMQLVKQSINNSAQFVCTSLNIAYFGFEKTTT